MELQERLLDACFSGVLEDVQTVLDLGASPSEEIPVCIPGGRGPPLATVVFGSAGPMGTSEALAECLIKAGADVNALWNGRHGLFAAADSYAWRVIMAMVRAGADVKVSDDIEDGRHRPSLLLKLSILYAMRKEFEIRECIRLVIMAGANPNVQDAVGWSPLRMAIQYGDMELLRLLLSKGADVKMKGPDGSTVLHYVCYSDGKVGREIFKILMSVGSVNGQN